MQVPVQWQGRRGQWTWELWHLSCQDHSTPASLALEACAKSSIAAVIPFQQHSQEKMWSASPGANNAGKLSPRKKSQGSQRPNELRCKAMQGWPQLRRFKKQARGGLEVRRGLWTLIELLQAYSGINEAKILILYMHSQKWMYAKPE